MKIIGFNRSKLVSDGAVDALVKDLDVTRSLLEKIKAIEYIDKFRETATISRRWGRRPILGLCDVNQVDGTAYISIFRQTKRGNHDKFEFVHNILHEVAHAIFDNLPSNVRARWFEMCSRSIVFLNSAGHDPREHFADMFAACQQGHLAMIREKFMKEFEFLQRNVLHGVA